MTTTTETNNTPSSSKVFIPSTSGTSTPAQWLLLTDQERKQLIAALKKPGPRNKKENNIGIKKKMRRDSDYIAYQALSVINDQNSLGAKQMDIMYRCEINMKYTRQVIAHFLLHELITKEGDIMYITEKGKQKLRIMEQVMRIFEKKSGGRMNPDSNSARVFLNYRWS